MFSFDFRCLSYISSLTHSWSLYKDYAFRNQRQKKEKKFRHLFKNKFQNSEGSALWTLIPCICISQNVNISYSREWKECRLCIKVTVIHLNY